MTTTPVAAAGPLFETVSVMTIVSPIATAGAAAMVAGLAGVNSSVWRIASPAVIAAGLKASARTRSATDGLAAATRIGTVDAMISGALYPPALSAAFIAVRREISSLKISSPIIDPRQ